MTVGVASECECVALKRCSGTAHQDETDTVALIKTDRVDLSGSPLVSEKVSPFSEGAEAAKADPHPA